MTYHLYLFKTSLSYEIRNITEAIRINTKEEWKFNCADEKLENFDTGIVREQIKETLGDDCFAIERHSISSAQPVPYLFIGTSFSKAEKIIPVLCKIAIDHQLVLFDEEQNKHFCLDMIDRPMIISRQRERELKQRITKEFSAMYKYIPYGYLRLADYMMYNTKCCLYCITLHKEKNISLAQQTESFYQLLQRSITPDEKLYCQDKGFAVSGKGYCFFFYLEAYGKHADKICYYKDGHPHTELMHRMSTLQAKMWIRQNCDDADKKDILSRLTYEEMMRRYKDELDRYMKSVYITRQLKKETFDIFYSDPSGNCGEVWFHVLDYNGRARPNSNFSMLSLSEESASFILPFIEEVYPYMYERFYYENHLPIEMLKDLVDRLSKAKSMIINDTFNPTLKPYAERFVWIFNNQPRIVKDELDARLLDPKNKWAVELFQYRYHVAHLMDVFIKWANEQLKLYLYAGGFMIDVSGP